MTAHADFSYHPGDEPPYGLVFSRTSVATFIDDRPDCELHYWPGALHLGETFARGSVATYIAETGYPES